MLDAGTTPELWTIVLLLLLPVAIMVTGFVLVVRYLRAPKEDDPGGSAAAQPPRHRRERDDLPD